MKDFKALGALKPDGLGVVYEDDDILAANKPVNMLLSQNPRRLIFLHREGLSDI